VRDKLKSYPSETKSEKPWKLSSENIWESSLITENNLNCWQEKSFLTNLLWSFRNITALIREIQYMSKLRDVC
jgi:hypothetical protein